MIIGTREGITCGMVICYLLLFWFSGPQNGGLILVLIFMLFANISMFTSYRARGFSVMMGKRKHVDVLGVDTVELKFTTAKIAQLENVNCVPSIKKNIVSGYAL
jgi:hypothetical protein